MNMSFYVILNMAIIYVHHRDAILFSLKQKKLTLFYLKTKKITSSF